MIVIISPSLSAMDWQLAWRSWEFFEHTQKWRSASARTRTRRRRVKCGRCYDTAGRIKSKIYLRTCNWPCVSSAYRHRRGLHFMFPLPHFHTAVSCGFHLNISWLSFENMKIFILWSLTFWRWCKVKLQLLGYDTAWFSYRGFGETCCLTSSVYNCVN